MDAESADLVITLLDLAGVQPSADLDPKTSQRIPGRKASDGPGRPIELAAIPSPVVFTSRPWYRASWRALTKSCNSSSSFQRLSPSSAAFRWTRRCQ